MKRIIFLLLALPFLFACNSNDTKSENNTSEKQTKVETTIENGTPKITYTLGDKKADSKEVETVAEELVPVSGLVSKTGNESAKRETIEDEDEALKKRRAHTQFNNGTNFYKSGDLENAIQSFKNSLEFKPNNAKAFYNLGNIYYDLGQKDLAQSYYKDAVEINPEDSLSLVAIGLICTEKGNLPEALDYYNKAVTVAPTFSMVYFNRGTLLGQNKQYQQSLDDLSKAIKYDPGNSEAYINRGLAHFYMKNIDLACKDWKKAKTMGNPKGTQAVDIYCSGKGK
mgnify:FL=1